MQPIEVLQGVGLVAIVLAGSFGIWRAYKRAARASGGSVLERLKRKIIGPPDQLPRRAVTAVLVLSIALALAGVFVATRTNIEAGSSSLPYLRPVLEIGTSLWAYVIGLAWICRRVLLKRDEKMADQAAEVTGYEPRSVRRLAYEARDPDGSTRVIATTDDAPEAIRDRVLEALETGEDDELTLNPAAFEERDEDDETAVPVPDAVAGEFRELEDRWSELVGRADELEAELDAASDDVLTADADPDAIADALASGEDRVAPIDLLGDEDRERADELAELTEELDEVLAEMDAVAEEIEALEELSGWRLEDNLADAQESASVLVEAAGLEDVVGDEGADEDELRDPWREELKMFRLDFASTIDFSEILWSLVLPAAATSALILLAVQLWVVPWLYPPIAAAGLVVGVLNYVRVQYTRSRRLEQLRADREVVNWQDVAILVKGVETPATRMYYARMFGRIFAHDDRQEFAEEVAHRAYEFVQGVPVSPSVQEKQAGQLKRLHPDLHGFRDAEKERIMDWLVEAVEGSQYGLVPKAKLIEDCIEHDIHDRRFLPGKAGKGYDPDLVREAYRDLVPAALVEQEVEIEGGNGETLTAVRLRSDPLPPEYAEVRAQFTSQFQNYASWTPMYELPAVDDRLEAEPVYADRLGYRGDLS